MSHDQEAWAKMEAQATEMTYEKYRKAEAIRQKLEKVRKFNLDHPVVKVTPVVVYESEPDPEEIAKRSAQWIGGYHKDLLKGFDLKKKKKKR